MNSERYESDSEIVDDSSEKRQGVCQI